MKYICIAGKNNIAVDVIAYLLKQSYDAKLCVVCTANDNGTNGWQRSLRLFARENHIQEYTLEETYELDDVVFLSLQFDKIIRPSRFKNARLYNVHFSLLPAYKGMYPAVMPILNNEKKSGVTLHRLDTGIDTGDIIAQKSFDIGNMTSRELYQKYVMIGTQLMIENMDAVINGREIAISQCPSESSYYSKSSIDYSRLEIDLNQTAQAIVNQIRAFHFREYQMPQIRGISYIDAQITNIRSLQKPGTFIYENAAEALIASVDYNVVLFKDRFDALLQACQNGDMAEVERICTVKAYINEQDSHGWTPLIVATYYGHTEIVQFLISHGADVWCVNNNGVNLLMYAKEAYKKTGSNELYRLYKNLGLTEEMADYQGLNLYDYLECDRLELADLTESGQTVREGGKVC